MGEFVGGRIVPKHCGVWSKNSKYEMLSIVYQPETGDSYISRKSVPAGTLLDSAEYWAICAEYSAQVHQLELDVDADVQQMHTDLAQTKADMCITSCASMYVSFTLKIMHSSGRCRTPSAAPADDRCTLCRGKQDPPAGQPQNRSLQESAQKIAARDAVQFC